MFLLIANRFHFDQSIHLLIIAVIYIAIAILGTPFILPFALMDIGYYLLDPAATSTSRSMKPKKKARHRSRPRKVKFRLTDSQESREKHRQNQPQWNRPQWNQQQPQPQSMMQQTFDAKPPNVLKLDTIPESDIETDTSTSSHDSDHRPIDIDTYQSSHTD